MKRLLAVALLVFGVPMFQGAVLAPFVPSFVRPDLALLVVFGLSLCWRNSATGLGFAAVCGFAVDLFSGGLLGQHALLGVLAFGAARALSIHVSMMGPFPQMIFAGLLTAAHSLAMAGLMSFFTPGSGLVVWGVTAVAPHIAVNAVLAPPAVAVVSRLVAWIAREETGRRPLRIATRRWAA